jgi:hypothetical protein
LLLLPIWDWLLLVRVTCDGTSELLRLMASLWFVLSCTFLFVHWLLYVGTPDPGYGTFTQCEEGEAQCSASGNANAGHLVNDAGWSVGVSIRRESSKCAICWEEYCQGDGVRQLACGHCYHDRCVGCWWLQSEACPMCRHRCLPQLLEHANASHTLSMERWECVLYLLTLAAFVIVFPSHHLV